MRRSLFLLILIGAAILNGAEFRISKDLKEAELTYIKENRRDANGDFCALIQINSDIQGLEFDSDRKPLAIIRESGNYKVYLSPGEKSIIFRKTGFAELEYFFPLTIRSNSAYTMTVVKGGYSSADEGLVSVTFEMNEDNVYISRPGNPPILSLQRSAQFRLSPAKYRFKFSKHGFNDLEKEIEIAEDTVVQIELQPGESETRLKLPGIVIINSEPSSAELYLNDQKMGITPWNDNLRAGEYKLTLKANMYYTAEQEFSLEEGQTLELPLIKLKPHYGTIKILPQSAPEEVKVFLNGKEIEYDKLPQFRKQSGTYKLVITHPDYHSYEEDIILRDGAEVEIEAELKPAFGILEIESTPVEGADVFLNGEYAGKTPYRDEKASSGEYHIRLEKELFTSAEETVYVEDEKETSKTLLLTRNYGTLEVEAEGSQIYVNDQYKADDFYRVDLPAGNYMVEARRDKHYPAVREIYLRIGAKEEIKLLPQPRQGSLSIISEPAETKGAEIWINDKMEKKTTPAVLPLLIGEYEIKLRKTGYLDASSVVNIEEGTKNKLLLKMETYSGSMLAKKNKWKRNGWIGTGTTLLALGAGVYFNAQADDYADEYYDAGNSSNASSAWDDMQSSFDKRDVCYYVSVVPALYSVYSWIKAASFKPEIQKK